MNKLIATLLSCLLLTACSGKTVIIETSAYLDSKAEGKLKVPADMDASALDSAYPVPEVKGSVKGKTQKELEALKTPPNLLSK